MPLPELKESNAENSQVLLESARSGEVPVLSSQEEVATPPPAVPVWKRGLDLFLILLLAPVLIPVMLATALAIKWLSNGPVLFRQTRIGYGCRRFELLKFRTMKVGAESRMHDEHLDKLIQTQAPMTKLDHQDPRLIPGGRWLRATGLDELPQLLNVLQGTMSFVGPRPCVPTEFAWYGPTQRSRFNGLPGLTGLWQVSGKNRLSFPEMIRLDECYIATVSPLLDLKILLKTPWAILSQVRDTARLRFGPKKQVPVRTRPAGATAVQG
ncbi:MAG: sugar transferase [Verrucomicrobia bacterium]|nr:sugar transferase [Verrucomicrobiota bacterium]